MVGNDVVWLVAIGLESSVIDNVFGVLSFFLSPLVDVFRNTKPCIIFQIIALSDFSFVIFHKFIQVRLLLSFESLSR